MALPLVQVRIAGSNVVWADETGAGGEAPVGRGWPAALQSAVVRARDRLWRLHGGDRYHSGARVTLGVYVDDPDDRLGPVPDELTDSVTRVERLPPPGRRPPATLPLRVVAATPEAVGVTQGLARYDGILPTPAGPDWWRLPADVLVTSRPPTRAPTHRARLVIAPPDTAPEPWMDALLHLPVDGGGAVAAVEEVVVGITHDLPLHDVVRQAMELRALAPGTRLWASPESDHALRISLVAARLAEEALDPLRAPQEGRPRGVIPEGLGSGDLPTPEVMYRATLPLSFDRESGGLRTLASTVRAMAIAPRRTLLGLTGRSRSSRRPSPRRAADLRLLRPPALVSARAHQGQRTLGDLAWVGRRTTLMAGQTYRLRFQIGASFPGNLLTGPSPDFDALLAREPDPAGHELTVVLYPQDFVPGEDVERRRPVVRALRLPPSGPSEALLFPVIPARLGRLQLRLSVYHRGSMLASYRLRARVTEGERDGRAAIEVRCDYTRGDAFADPRPEEARDLHLAVNASGGTHDLMVLDPGGSAAGPSAADARVTVRAVGDFLTAARALMNPMAANPVYRLHQQLPSAPARLATDLHALARLGQDLVLGLLQGDRALRPLFRRVREGHDLYLQAVRHTDAPALPWALGYDWPLPELPPATACLGAGPDGGPCAHDHTTPDIVCARGFWGIRHRIEERVDNGSDWPERLPAGGVALALDPTSAHWQAYGLVPPPAGVTLVAPTTPVLAALAAPDRAPVFGVLGHHAVDTPPAAPGGAAPAVGGLSRLEVGPGGRALRLADVKNLALGDDWAAPPDPRRPLVLLMACETAVGQERDVYVDYLGPLVTVGAAGVVSTQTVVGYDLLGWTTRRLVGGLLGGARLAAAMRDARAALLRERYSPLGFLFTAVANGDLHLPPGPP